MAIENDLTRIAVALEGILAHLKAIPTVVAVSPPEVAAAAAAPVLESGEALVATEPPKKKRGRPSKAELEARAAAPVVAEAELAAVSEPPLAAALPVEQPVCPDCGVVLTAENSAKSSMTGKLLHVNCKAQPAAPANPNAETEKTIEKAREPVLTIEKVREAAIALTQRCEKAKPGTGRDALVSVLASFGVKSISELPEPKWPAFVDALKAA